MPLASYADEAQAPHFVHSIFEGLRQSKGFVYNSYRVMAHNPDALRAFAPCVGAILQQFAPCSGNKTGGPTRRSAPTRRGRPPCHSLQQIRRLALRKLVWWAWRQRMSSGLPLLAARPVQG